MNNPNKRPPPSSSAGNFEGGDATKRSREAILRPGKDAPSNVLLVRISDIVHPVRGQRTEGGRAQRMNRSRDREREGRVQECGLPYNLRDFPGAHQPRPSLFSASAFAVVERVDQRFLERKESLSLPSPRAFCLPFFVISAKRRYTPKRRYTLGALSVLRVSLRTMCHQIQDNSVMCGWLAARFSQVPPRLPDLCRSLGCRPRTWERGAGLGSPGTSGPCRFLPRQRTARALRRGFF